MLKSLGQCAMRMIISENDSEGLARYNIVQRNRGKWCGRIVSAEFDNVLLEGKKGQRRCEN